jgi:hypothetical protein
MNPPESMNTTDMNPPESMNTATSTTSEPPPAIDPKKGSQFILEFGRMQEAAHTINRANGWWNDRYAYLESGLPNAHANTVCALVGLAHTELSEAIEAARKHPQDTWGDPMAKDTMVRELAGTVVRVMDLAQVFELPLGRAIVEELNSNAARGFRHGGKAA